MESSGNMGKWVLTALETPDFKLLMSIATVKSFVNICISIKRFEASFGELGNACFQTFNV